MEQNLSEAMFGSAFKDRAFPVYAAMRERGPVTRTTLPSGEAFGLVTRYAECLELLKDDERFANDPARAMTEEEYAALFQQATQGLTPEQQAFAAETDEILSRNLLGVDPPDHSRLRRLVAIPFTPKYIEGLRPRV
jgi:cytochrome P450